MLIQGDIYHKGNVVAINGGAVTGSFQSLTDKLLNSIPKCIKLQVFSSSQMIGNNVAQVINIVPAAMNIACFGYLRVGVSASLEALSRIAQKGYNVFKSNK
ncbi:1444_t:CDS:2 [Funneliformis geosporum]|nr:1444_t:CDS:2 [Funneliformis geosporum]